MCGPSFAGQPVENRGRESELDCAMFIHISISDDVSACGLKPERPYNGRRLFGILRQLENEASK